MTSNSSGCGNHRRFIIIVYLVTCFFAIINELAHAQVGASRPPASSADIFASKAQQTVELLEKNSLTNKRVNATIVGEAVFRFLVQLDPERSLFSKSEVGKITARTDSYTDALRHRDLRPFLDIYRLYLERLASRLVAIQEICRKPLFFEEVEYLVAGTKYDWPCESDAEFRSRWRQFVKFWNLTFESTGVSEAQSRRMLIESYRQELERNSAGGDQRAFALFMGALCKTFDRHAGYVPAAVLEHVTGSVLPKSEAEPCLRLNDHDGIVTIRFVFDRTQLGDNAIRPGDRLLRIDREPRESVYCKGVNLFDLTKQGLEGPRGSEVMLTFGRPDSPTAINCRLKRGCPSLVPKGNMESLNAKTGVAKIARISVPFFPYRDSEEFNRQVDELLDSVIMQGARAMVLDLRDSGGSNLVAMQKVAGRFLGRRPILLRTQRGRREEIWSTANSVSQPIITLPLVVLVNESTRGVAETLAAALSDSHRAIVAGTGPTSADGAITEMYDIGEIKLGSRASTNARTSDALITSVAEFRRLNGESLAQTGVECQIEIKMSESPRNDTARGAEPRIVNEQEEAMPVGLTREGILMALKRRSEQRLSYLLNRAESRPSPEHDGCGIALARPRMGSSRAPNSSMESRPTNNDVRVLVEREAIHIAQEYSTLCCRHP